MNSEKEIWEDPGFRSRLSEIVDADEPFAWATRIGIPSASFSRMWKFGVVPKAPHLKRIREATGVSLDWLLTGEGPMRRLGEYIPTPTTSAPTPAPTPIQEDLLEHVITAIEIFLNQNNLGMHPDKKARLVVILYRIFARRRIERAAKAQEMGEEYHEPTISISGEPDIADMVRLMV